MRKPLTVLLVSAAIHPKTAVPMAERKSRLEIAADISGVLVAVAPLAFSVFATAERIYLFLGSDTAWHNTIKGLVRTRNLRKRWIAIATTDISGSLLWIPCRIRIPVDKEPIAIRIHERLTAVTP